MEVQLPAIIPPCSRQEEGLFGSRSSTQALTYQTEPRCEALTSSTSQSLAPDWIPEPPHIPNVEHQVPRTCG